MKKRLTLAVLLLLTSFAALAQDEIEYKVYSYTKFFQMIEAEEDSIFRLSDAKIIFNKETDQDFYFSMNDPQPNQATRPEAPIVIDKEVILTNTQFAISRESGDVYGLHNIQFNKRVSLNGSSEIIIGKCTFNDDFEFSISNNHLIKQTSSSQFIIVGINDNTFKRNVNIYLDNIAETSKGSFLIDENRFEFDDPKPDDQAGLIFLIGGKGLRLTDNHFTGSHTYNFKIVNFENLSILKNTFKVAEVEFKIDAIGRPLLSLKFEDNLFETPTFFRLTDFNKNHDISWTQFKKGIFNREGFQKVNLAQIELDSIQETRLEFKTYRESLFYQNEKAFKEEIKLRSDFYSYFKSRFDNKNANLVYVDMKELETQRLGYLYSQTPSFETFFKWRINQFLEIFSAYGTKPEKAVVFSLYVILAFALVYLFFPNHWDSHGKDRILHRYQFFFKYLNKDAGMHDVYLEGKQDELAHYDGFKNFFIENGKTVPKFFLATALPLYRWSTASTRSSSWFLSKIDIFKGKWADLPAPQRAAKTVLLTLAFAIALTYDIFIKMLNALMLSINTFTTLGFGEIPIKGLPRYLAIIQGFIGWFMLTIFSVSLISQLLN